MNTVDDKGFADRLANDLPDVAPSAALQARILADFDRLPRRMTWRALAEGLANTLWPGAPLWQPAAALGLSLAVGLMAGAFVPAMTTSAVTASTASDPVVMASDTPLVMDLYRDL